jgi:hypothetical protein
VKRKRKSRSLKSGDPRIWAESTLTEDMPTGPQGQPSHPKGSRVTLSAEVKLGDVPIGFTYPRPSELLFRKTQAIINKALHARKRALDSIDQKGFILPHVKGYIWDEEELFYTFENAFLGILGLHASLEALASELMFNTDKLEIDKTIYTKAELLNKGLEFKLTKMASAVTGKENIYGNDIHDELKKLINLRHKLQHWNLPKPQNNFSELGKDHPMSYVLNENLETLLRATRSIIDYYKVR